MAANGAAKGVRPLDGIRILAAEHMLAAPFGTMLLADMGAEVIKVEPPKGGELARRMGPHLRGPNGEPVSGTFLRQARNKKSLTLDLKTERGREIFKDLAKRSDVVVENLRAGVMERLGLGYDDLAPENPRLIYFSMSGFGHNAKYESPYVDWPSYGPLAEAWAGISDLVGYEDLPPIGWLGMALGDVYSSVMGMLGLMMALRYRDLTGLGQYVDMSMYDCLLTLNEHAVMNHGLTGKFPLRGASGSCPVGPFECSDGYVMIVAIKNEDWGRICHVIGRPEWAQREDLAGHAQRHLLLDDLIRPAVEEWTRPRTKLEAARELVAGNVPAAPINRVDDLAKDPHVRSHRMLVEVDHAAGKVAMVGNPLKLSRVDEVYASPPALGQHTDELLTRLLGLSAGEIAALREAGVV